MTFETGIIELDRRPVAGAGGLFVSPGYGSHPDRVIDSWELIYVRTSRLHIEENGVEFFLEPGQALVLPAHRRHRGLSIHPKNLSFYWIHFEVTGPPLVPPVQLRQYGPVARPDWLSQLFHQYIADQTAGVSTSLSADALLLLMLTETIVPKLPVVAAAGVAAVQRAEEYISHRLHLGITPADVAQAINYSRPHLSRLFRQTHGVTLGGFIHRTQVAQARTLLHDSVSPLKQIASQCGFSDVGYFRRVFRRELGISPREYRNRFGRVRINRD